MKNGNLWLGGNGFIGSHTTISLIESGYKVVIVDNLSNSKYGVILSSFVIYRVGCFEAIKKVAKPRENQVQLIQVILLSLHNYP